MPYSSVENIRQAKVIFGHASVFFTTTFSSARAAVFSRGGAQFYSAPGAPVALNFPTGGGYLHPQKDCYLANFHGRIRHDAGAEVEFDNTNDGFNGNLWCDRLCHQSGLDATITTAQTTNLPTAALPRYTDGKGVWIAHERCVAVGTTASDITVSYTNQDGTSGRTSPTTTFTVTGNVDDSAIGQLYILPLQEGDTGVRSVQSVTLSGSTGTAGNFGITLLKPLWYTPTESYFSFQSAYPAMFGNAFDPLLSTGVLLPLGHIRNATGSGQGGFCWNMSFMEA